MEKVNEKVDLSRKILEIDLESAIFNAMKQDLNEELLRVVKKVFDEEFESGEISLKLSIEIPNAYGTFTKTDEDTGELLTETFKYRKPLFEHKITTTLKKQYKQDGTYTEARDVRYEDGRYIAVPVKQAQMDMFE